jgi:hypothetical protein
MISGRKPKTEQRIKELVQELDFVMHHLKAFHKLVRSYARISDTFPRTLFINVMYVGKNDTSQLRIFESFTPGVYNELGVNCSEAHINLSHT